MMKPLVGLVAVLLAVAGCATRGPTPSLTSTSTVRPTVTAAFTPAPSPRVSCGDFVPADCQAAAVAALAFTPNQSGAAIRVDLGRGIFCPIGLAFDTTTCPAGSLPPAGGGRWIGNAVVTFAGSSAQASYDLAKNGETVRGVFVGFRTPPPPSPSPS